MSRKSDRNFDDLQKRFKRNIYGTPKGQLRLAALRGDFKAHNLYQTEQPLKVLDIGGGMGQFSLELAQQGHEIHLCDISEEMLEQGKALFTEQAPQAKVTFQKCSLQDTDTFFPDQYDIVMNHAVLEWVEDQAQALHILHSKVKAGGHLSLMFYNLHGRTWRGLMNGKLHAPTMATRFNAEHGIAPQQPLDPQWVKTELDALNFEVLSWRGIRFIYDHMHQKIRDRVGLENITESEWDYGTQAPYRDLARYVHMLCYKP